MRSCSSIPQRCLRGFTLVEVLVALLVMAIMAVLSWQGIDGMARANQGHRERADDVASIQTALLQWKTDLDHLTEAAPTPPGTAASSASAAKAIEFDGRILRVTRRFGADELRVVAWGARRIETQTGSSRRFLRWVSEPVRTRAQWQFAWDQAGRWGQNPSDADRAMEAGVLNLDDWQIFYYRNDSWSNPLSAGATAQQSSAHPDGVRLILQLAPNQVPGGQLTVDWVLPTRGGKL